ncbi:hypothetical protein ALC57_06129, partial [Trachymyrmex cornetzi]
RVLFRLKSCPPLARAEGFILSFMYESRNRGDFASLVRNLLGPIYGDNVMNLLIRQARDILVCAYHGNLENFVRTYLSPAAVLLAEVKNVASETVSTYALRLPVLSVVKQPPPSPLSLDGICVLASLELSCRRRCGQPLGQTRNEFATIAWNDCLVIYSYAYVHRAEYIARLHVSRA